MESFFSSSSGWLALGLILIALEAIIPGYIFLAFGIGAMFGGALHYIGLLPIVTEPIWLNIAMFVAVFSFIALLVLKKFFAKKSKQQDINNY